MRQAINPSAPSLRRRSSSPNAKSWATSAAAATVRPTQAFLVGRDVEGHWLAVETHGLGGGLFVTRDAALRYAESETARRPGAVEIAHEPIALR